MLRAISRIFARKPSQPALRTRDPRFPILLSICAHGRNTRHMGDFPWRLGTAINRYVKGIEDLGAQGEVEIILCDFGSTEPLSEAMPLSDGARRLLKIIEVPPSVAAKCNQDSSYSFVHAANCAIRRAQGEFVMYCDGDTYLPTESLQAILQVLRGERSFSKGLEDHFFLASRYHIPLSFHRHEATLEALDEFVSRNRETLDHDKLKKKKFEGTATAYLFHRSIWHECRGFDERMIYWGWFDIDLFYRLKFRYGMVDLEDEGIYFYHLEHYSNSQKRDLDSENPQLVNPQVMPRQLTANDENWGLWGHEFPLKQVGSIDALSQSRRS